MTAEQRSRLLDPEPPTTDTRPIVPDLIGLSLRDACQAAAWAGIRLSTGSTRRQGPSGMVVAQSPPPGSRLQPLWCVHVLVSVGVLVDEPLDA